MNHQGTHIQKPGTDMDTTFSMIHDLNFPKKHQTLISTWRMWNKPNRTLCEEN